MYRYLLYINKLPPLAMLSYRILYLKGKTKLKPNLFFSIYGLGLREREVDLHSQIH